MSFSCPKCRLVIEPMALPTRGGEAAFKPLSPNLTRIWFKMSLCNGILTGCKVAPTLQEPMSVELMGMQNWHTIH